MFLKINTVETNTLWSHGAHILSDAASMLAGIASVTVGRSSQTERQLNKLHALLGCFTRYSTVDYRYNVFSYGEAHFWGKPAPVHLEPGIERIVDEYVAKAKAA